MPRRSATGRSPSVPQGPQRVDSGTVEFIRDDDGVLVLINGTESSHLNVHHPDQLTFEYMQWMSAVIDGLMPSGRPLDVLHLGGAGCTMACYLDATRPGSHQVAVEIDKAMIDLVRSALPLPRAPQLRIRHGDARTELERFPQARFDLIIRDAFAGASTPEHLRTEEFSAIVASRLRDGGLYLANSVTRPDVGIVTADAVGVRKAFGAVRLLTEPSIAKGRRFGNVVIAATSGGGDRLDGLGLDRALRRCTPPATYLAEDETRRYLGSAVPVSDQDIR